VVEKNNPPPCPSQEGTLVLSSFGSGTVYLAFVYKPADFKKDAIVLKIPLSLTLSPKGRGDTLNSPPLRGGDEGEGD